MGDMVELFKDVKALRQQEKQAAAAKRLSELPAQMAEIARLGFKVRRMGPDGPHLRIDGDIDFWPSTGRWIITKGGGRGMGYAKLLRVLQARKAAA